MTSLDNLDAGTLDRIFRWLSCSNPLKSSCRYMNSAAFASVYLNRSFDVTLPCDYPENILGSWTKWESCLLPYFVTVRLNEHFEYAESDAVLDKMVDVSSKLDICMHLCDPSPLANSLLARFDRIVDLSICFRDYDLACEVMLENLQLPETCRFFGLKYDDAGDVMMMEFPSVLPVQRHVKYLDLHDVNFMAEDIVSAFPNLKALACNCLSPKDSTGGLTGLRALVITSPSMFGESLRDLHAAAPNLEILAVTNFDCILPNGGDTEQEADHPAFEKLRCLVADVVDCRDFDGLCEKLPAEGACFPALDSMAITVFRYHQYKTPVTITRRAFPNSIRSAYVYVDAMASLRWINQAFRVTGNRIAATEGDICIEASTSKNNDLLPDGEVFRQCEDRDLRLHPLEFVKKSGWCNSREFKDFVAEKCFA